MIFVQDYRSRAVYWVCFPLLALAFIALYAASHGSLVSYWHMPLIDLAFVFLQLLLVTVWFSIKNGKLINITAGLLGWGDVLFIGCLGFCFSLINFILFYISSLLMVLLIWMLGRKILFKDSKHIPLAGLQALLLAGVLLTTWIRGIDVTSDEQFIRFFVK